MGTILTWLYDHAKFLAACGLVVAAFAVLFGVFSGSEILGRWTDIVDKIMQITQWVAEYPAVVIDTINNAFDQPAPNSVASLMYWCADIGTLQTVIIAAAGFLGGLLSVGFLVFTSAVTLIIAVFVFRLSVAAAKMIAGFIPDVGPQ